MALFSSVMVLHLPQYLRSCPVLRYTWRKVPALFTQRRGRGLLRTSPVGVLGRSPRKSSLAPQNSSEIRAKTCNSASGRPDQADIISLKPVYANTNNLW